MTLDRLGNRRPKSIHRIHPVGWHIKTPTDPAITLGSSTYTYPDTSSSNVCTNQPRQSPSPVHTPISFLLSIPYVQITQRPLRTQEAHPPLPSRSPIVNIMAPYPLQSNHSYITYAMIRCTKMASNGKDYCWAPGSN